MNNNQVLKYLKDNNFFPSKKMGQNFLINDDYKKKIVNSININENDFVLEIGPGFGALTNFIYKKTKNITLVELDKRLADVLSKNFNDIELINNDILKVNLDELIESKHNFDNKFVISNLPYSVSSQILFNLLKTKKIDSMVLMVQKEMSDRITSKVGTKKYNGFSIIISLIANVEKLFDVPPSSFYPAPNVISTVIKVTPKKTIDFEINKMEKFVKICFLNKRKKLVNNLKTSFELNKIMNVLNDLNIDSNIRPEQLEPKIFIDLMKGLQNGN